MTELLLDTCAMLWMMTDPSKLSSNARQQIENTSNALAVSAISGFEIGLLHRDGQVRLESGPESWFDHSAAKFIIEVIPISWRIAMRSALLPQAHKDPADRISVATSLERRAVIVTPDRHIIQYSGIQVCW